MSSINRQAGWYGYTIDTTGTGNATNDHGETTTCIFGVNFAYHVNDVDVKISKNENDWGAQMGDGTIIPLSDPQVLYQHRTNAVIQFKMKTPYASNTPCSLLYMSDDAYIAIIDVPRKNEPFKPHTATGRFAITTDRYGANINKDGEVNKLLATIYYPYFAANHEFEITKDDGCWSAQFGNGDVIPLTRPEVLAINKDNAVVLFTMEQVYPSNTPCLLLAEKETSIFKIIPIADKFTFIPVEDIVDCPIDVIGGLSVDLSSATTKPYDATSKEIEWQIISGGTGTAELRDGHILYAKQKGTVKLRATIQDAKDIGVSFTKDFTINVIENKITILADANTYLRPIVDEITETVNIIAVAVNELQRVQWYYTTTKITTVDASTFPNINAKELPNGNDSTVDIPTNWKKGDYYIFCKISSPEAPDVYSKVCHVHTINRCNSFHIVVADEDFHKISDYSPTVDMYLESIKNFTIDVNPENSDIGKISWFLLSASTSTDETTKKENEAYMMASLEDKELVDSDGVSTRHGCTVSDCHRWGDTFKLKAVGYCGITKLEDTITIKTAEFYPVKELTGLLTQIETSENEDQNTTLRATVVSTVAGKEPTNKNIIWEIVKESHNNAWTKGNKQYIHYQDPIHGNEEMYNTEATLVDGNKLVAKKPGWIKVRAIIKNGLAPHDSHLIKENIDVVNNVGYDFVYEYMVKVVQAFIPVEDMQLTSDTVGIKSNSRLRLEADVKSGTVGNTTNSTKREYGFEVVSAGTTGVKIQGQTLIIPKEGTMTVRGRVLKGKMSNHKEGDDFTKDFNLVVTADGFVSIENVDVTFTPEAHQVSFDKNGNKVVSSTPSPEMFNSNNIVSGSSVVMNNIVFTITPTNATNKNITISVIKPTAAERYEYYDGEDIEDGPQNGDIIAEDIGEYVTLSGSTNTDRKVSVAYNALKAIDSGIAQHFRLKLEIANAINKTQKFEKTVFVNVVPLDLDPFYPIQDVLLTEPKPNRALVPMLLDHVSIQPNNASVLNDGILTIDTRWNTLNTNNENEETRINSQIIAVDGSSTAMIDWLKYIYDNDAISWDLNSLYCYNWSKGNLVIKLEIPESSVENAKKNPVVYGANKISFEKTFSTELLDPYIAVKSISLGIANPSGSIPLLRIPRDKAIILDPLIETLGGINYYNADWDEEIPTYSVPEYSIIGAAEGLTLGNNINVEIEAYHNGDKNDNSNIVNFETVIVSDDDNHGIIKGTVLTSDTKYRIKISIRNGKQETMVWYGNVQRGLPFEQQFDVEIIDYSDPSINGVSEIENAALNGITNEGRSWNRPSNTSISIPIARLYDASGNVLDVYDIYDLTWCSNSKPSSFVMNINGKSMRKDEVIRVEFCNASSLKESIKSKVRSRFNSYKNDDNEDAVNSACSSAESWINGLTVNDYASKVTNLSYFGRNFINLIQINSIPSHVTYLEGFLYGCTSFNMAITIPKNVTGGNCLKYFMKDCITFNSVITFEDDCPELANSMGGTMHGFLEGCLAYDKPLTIPSVVTGVKCMERLLKDCTSFNSQIVFPENASGGNMLKNALEGCKKFNQPITLPRGIWTNPNSLFHFLYGANDFKSDITVYAAPALDSNSDNKYDETDYPSFINEHSFGSKVHLSNIAGIGIMFKCTETPETNGWDGANLICRLTTNNYDSNNTTVFRNVHSANCDKCPYHNNCDKLEEEEELIQEGVLDNNHKVLK